MAIHAVSHFGNGTCVSIVRAFSRILARVALRVLHFSAFITAGTVGDIFTVILRVVGSKLGKHWIHCL